MTSRFINFLQSLVSDKRRNDHNRSTILSPSKHITTVDISFGGANNNNNENIRISRKRSAAARVNLDARPIIDDLNGGCSPKKIPKIQHSVKSFELVNISDDELDSRQRNPLKMNQNSNRIAKKSDATDATDDVQIVKMFRSNAENRSVQSAFDRLKTGSNRRLSLRTSAVPSRVRNMVQRVPDSTFWWPIKRTFEQKKTNCSPAKNSTDENTDLKAYSNRIYEFTRHFFRKSSYLGDYTKQKPIATIDLTGEKTDAEKEFEKCEKLTGSLRQKSVVKREEIERNAAEKQTNIRLQHNFSTRILADSLENDLMRLTIKKKQFRDESTFDSDIIEVPVLPEIPDDKRQLVVNIFRGFNDKEVIVKHENDSITRHDLKTLQPRGWLNDEIINYYLNMVRRRNETKQLRSVHVMNTFFLIRYRSSGYSSVRRWTKNVDIFAKDFFIVPVHLGCHWCIITVDMPKKQCFFYDSMLVARDEFVQLIRQYLIEEHRNKKQSELDTSEWQFAQNFDIPKQTNSWDCGVFSCTFAEFVTRNVPLTATSFAESDMDYFRMKMAAEILDGQLLT